MEQVVKLEDNSKKGFRFVSLFEEAIAEQDTAKALTIIMGIVNVRVIQVK